MGWVSTKGQSHTRPAHGVGQGITLTNLPMPGDRIKWARRHLSSGVTPPSTRTKKR
jgi:hypothetical protein